ncbi:MAG: hypothetical protein JWP81_4249 [Ferruginibacter sp.]|nr:hypothetical protein [Ferruginibacter sp.]
MKGIIYVTCLLLLPVIAFSQRITYSEPQREDNRDINFDIIGKMNNNIIVFKNAKWKYAVSVYNAADMELKEKVDLDFIPDKAFNVEYIAFSDNFYFIYQYQKRGIVYCMAAKMDANGHLIDQPIQLDTTHIGGFGDNKIYSTINSDDKKHIMVFKIQKKDDQFNFLTILFNNKLEMVHKSRLVTDYDEHNDVYSDFLLDNDGNFLFSKSVKANNRSNISGLSLVTKAPFADTFSIKKINLSKFFIDEIKIKIDNVNKRYLLSSFYYPEKRGNIDGLFCSIWDVKGDSAYTTVFTKLDESIRAIAKAKGNMKFAFNDFFIRHILLKKDGSFLIAAEDYSSQTSSSSGWNRWDYLYGSPFSRPYNYYYYSPAYGGYYYRPYNSFGNAQSTRYYYDNILLLYISKTGRVESDRIINKEQYADDNDNFLSFSTFITESEIHFLFNLIEKRDKLLTDNTITSNGELKRNPTIKSLEPGYEFMPKLSKQIGARQIVIPCSFRNQICFAKIDF